MRPPLESDSPLSPDAPEPSAAEKPKKHSGISFLKELPVLILIAFGLALLIKTFLIQAFFIPSESMVPTLQINDRVLVNKLVYRFRDPRRGEIVVFVAERDSEPPKSFFRKVADTVTEGLGAKQPPEKDFIKRVIGLPGDTVDLRDGVITITTKDGKKLTLKEPYLSPEKDPDPYGPFTVPPESYFVMGDNRPNSSDSRVRGAIKRSDIVGKAFVKVWPLGRAGILRRPKYGPPVAASGLVVLPVALALRRRRRPRPRAA